MSQDKTLKKFLSERRRKKATAGVREIASRNRALQRLLAKSHDSWTAKFWYASLQEHF